MRDPRINMTRGETAPLVLEFFDQEGTAVSLKGGRALFSLSYSPNSDNLVTRDTESDGEELIKISENTLIIYLTLSESLSLPVGNLFADAWVKLSGKWIRMDTQVIVEVGEGIATPPVA